METPEPPPPLCFVLMPFGRKTDAAGRVTNFDSAFHKVIAPAVERAGLEPIRADEDKIGGTIHKPMFERLMLCHYAVADITGANPNVFYELGIRHALRPSSTVILFVEGTVMPFDIALVRGISYKTDGAGEPVDPEVPIAAIAAHLTAARTTPYDDSPIFQLIDVSAPFTDRSHQDRRIPRTDRLFEEVQGAACRRRPRRGGRGQAHRRRARAQDFHDIETGIIVDLYLSLRDVEAYAAMIELYERMPPPLQRAKMMREQLGFALNREGRFEDAEKVLKDVIAEFGASSETNGLLGRIYKDRWTKALEGNRPEARSLLRRAIDTYLQGFEADWRDAYPGVNALTLMEQLDKPDPRKAQILPVVYYSVRAKRRATPTIGTTRHCWSFPCSATIAMQLTRISPKSPRAHAMPGKCNRPSAISA